MPCINFCYVCCRKDSNGLKFRLGRTFWISKSVWYYFWLHISADVNIDLNTSKIVFLNICWYRKELQTWSLLLSKFTEFSLWKWYTQLFWPKHCWFYKNTKLAHKNNEHPLKTPSEVHLAKNGYKVYFISCSR